MPWPEPEPKLLNEQFFFFVCVLEEEEENNILGGNWIKQEFSEGSKKKKNEKRRLRRNRHSYLLKFLPTETFREKKKKNLTFCFSFESENSPRQISRKEMKKFPDFQNLIDLPLPYRHFYFLFFFFDNQYYPLSKCAAFFRVHRGKVWIVTSITPILPEEVNQLFCGGGGAMNLTFRFSPFLEDIWCEFH